MSTATTGAVDRSARIVPRALLPVLVVLRALLSIALWRHSGGFFWLTGDDASRMSLAFMWSEDPFFNLPGNPFWLPLGTWIHGVVLSFVPDPLLTSAVVSSVFSIGTMVLTYWITHLLFPTTPQVAPLAAAFVGFTPWIVWLGLSGLSEPIFHLFMLGGVFCWLLAHRYRRARYSLLAALGFLGASMIRYEGWLLVVLFGGFSLLDARRSGRRLQTLASVVLAAAFIPIWLGWQWSVFGDPLHFARAASPLSRDVGLSPYVTMLVAISPWVCGLAVLGVGLSLWRREGIVRYLILVVAFYLGLIASMGGTVPGNLPIRNLTSMFLLIAPYAAYTVSSVFEQPRRSRYLIAVAAVVAMVIGAWQSFDYRFQPRASVVATATWSRQLLNSMCLDDETQILIEVRRGGAAEQGVVWDSLFFRSVRPDRIIYDRRGNWVYRDGLWFLQEEENPSLLEGAPLEVAERLRANRVGIVVAYSEAVHRVLGTFMQPIREADEYRMYAWPGASLLPADEAADRRASRCQ